MANSFWQRFFGSSAPPPEDNTPPPPKVVASGSHVRVAALMLYRKSDASASIRWAWASDGSEEKALGMVTKAIGEDWFEAGYVVVATTVFNIPLAQETKAKGDGETRKGEPFKEENS